MAKNAVLVLVIWCVLQVAPLASAECGGGFPQLAGCGLLNKDLTGCFTKQYNAAISTLAPGSRAMNLASIDPLVVPYSRINVEDGSRKLVLKRCTLIGGKDAKLSNLKISVGSSISYDLEVPKFYLECKRYSMSDGFLSAKKNRGSFALSMPNYISRFSLKTEAVTQQCNQKYFQYLSCDSSFLSASDFVASFSGLGQQQLRQDSLKTVVTKALAKVQAQFTLEYLTKIYAFSPPVGNWAPNSTTDNAPVCLQPRPTQCTRGTD